MEGWGGAKQDWVEKWEWEGAGSIGEPFWFLVSGQDTSLGPQLTTLPAQSPEGASPEAPIMLQWRGQ